MQLTSRTIKRQDSGPLDLSLCPWVSGSRRFRETRFVRNVASLNSSTLLNTAIKTRELGPGSNAGVPGSNLAKPYGILIKILRNYDSHCAAYDAI